jgi:hypothetical protein
MTPNKLERLSWPGFMHKYETRLERVAKDKFSNLFNLDISDEEKSFISLTPGVNLLKHFLHH